VGPVIGSVSVPSSGYALVHDYEGVPTAALGAFTVFQIFRLADTTPTVTRTHLVTHIVPAWFIARQTGTARFGPCFRVNRMP